MIERLLADAVLILHLLFIVFVVAGGFLAIRWPKIAWVHIPCALWGAWIEFAGRVCPLTPLENSLRRAGGEAGYGGGFIEHHLLPIIYPGELTRELQIGLGVGVLVLNAVAYALVLRRLRRRRGELHDGNTRPTLE